MSDRKHSSKDPSARAHAHALAKPRAEMAGKDKESKKVTFTDNDKPKVNAKIETTGSKYAYVCMYIYTYIHTYIHIYIPKLNKL